MEYEINELVEDKLREYGLTLRPRTCLERLCPTCGKANEQNLDYRGHPNGYRTHQIGECIENLRERIERLEAARE